MRRSKPASSSTSKRIPTIRSWEIVSPLHTALKFSRVESKFSTDAHNDGPSINGILQKYAGCKIIFFPAGLYLTDETIYVPPGSRIVGESLGTVISGESPLAH